MAQQTGYFGSTRLLLVISNHYVSSLLGSTEHEDLSRKPCIVLTGFGVSKSEDNEEMMFRVSPLKPSHPIGSR